MYCYEWLINMDMMDVMYSMADTMITCLLL